MLTRVDSCLLSDARRRPAGTATHTQHTPESDRQGTTHDQAATALEGLLEGRARTRARTDEEARPQISQTCEHPLTKQTNTAPERAARATAPTSGASGPVVGPLQRSWPERAETLLGR